MRLLEPGYAVAEPLHAAAHDFPEQLSLGAEVFEEGPRREVRLGGERINSDPVVAPLAERPGCGRQDARARAPFMVRWIPHVHLALPWRHGTPPGRARLAPAARFGRAAAIVPMDAVARTGVRRSNSRR